MDSETKGLGDRKGIIMQLGRIGRRDLIAYYEKISVAQKQEPKYPICHKMKKNSLNNAYEKS